MRGSTPKLESAAHPRKARFRFNRNAGRIVSLIGDSSRIGEANISLAAATRAGTMALGKSLAKELGRNNITVNTDLPVDLPDILAQGHEIEQVFVNIISNARHALNEKFSGPHEDKILEISARPVTSKGHSFVEVFFKDYGSGIPPDVLDKVMNPFFSTKTEGKRTGLGLSISLGIVQDHGGRLRIESEEGRYTKVVMELPVHLSTEQ